MSEKNKTADPVYTGVTKVLTILNYIAIAILGIAAIYIIVECNMAMLTAPNYYTANTEILQGLHVIFCTLGCMGLMCAILIPIKLVHVIMGSMGSLLIIIGIGFQMCYNYVKESIHLGSKHSVLGLISLLFIILVVVFGILVFSHVHCYGTVFYLEMCHHLFGLIAFFFGSYALCHGIKNLEDYLYKRYQKWILYVLIIITTLWCTILSVLKLVQKKL